jgi:DNA-directed RNA polymerase specialized sigma24 family protein
MSYAARVVRCVVIDQVRRRTAHEGGDSFAVASLELQGLAAEVDPEQLSRIADALGDLAKVDANSAEIVDLRFFYGFSLIEIVAIRGVPQRTVQRSWKRARLYLHRSIRAAVV